MVRRGSLYLIWGLVIALAIGYGARYAITPVGLVVLGVSLLTALFLPIAGESQLPLGRGPREAGDAGSGERSPRRAGRRLARFVP